MRIELGTSANPVWCLPLWAHLAFARKTETLRCLHSHAMLITALKRSLRRLCFYRCLSIHRGRACMAGGMHGGGGAWGYAWGGMHGREACVVGGGMHGRGTYVAGGLCGRGACMVGVCMAGGVHGRGCAWQGVCMVGGVHGGVHGREVCVVGEACMAGGHVWQGGACVAGWRAWQILWDMVNEWAVCILLECILVLVKLSKSKSQLVHSDSKVSDCVGRSRNYQRGAILSGRSRISQMDEPTQDGVTNLLLPPTNKVCGKVIFLHLSVILFTGGSTREYPLGRSTPLQAGTDLPGQVHPPGQVHRLAGTLPRQVCPPDRYPSGQVPPWAGTPPPNSACWDMVNKRVVRILLECILVWTIFLPKAAWKWKNRTERGHNPSPPRKSTTGLEW